MIRYERARDIEKKIEEIIDKLELKYIHKERVIAVRSFGSKSKYIIARCHSLPRIIQAVFKVPAHYIIEIVTENFEKLSEEDKIKTLIHEVLHIPKSFGGGFRHHRPYVNRRTVEKAYKKFISA